ncbi:MAG: hypothetical protein ABI693_03550 [Bryobacteraceae bacterium]
MRRPLIIVASGLIAIVGILYGGFRIAANHLAGRLQAKAAEAQSGVREWASKGRDPSAVVAVLQQVKPALDAGETRKAEVLLDQALQMLRTAAQPGDQSPLPVYNGVEETSDLYIRPQAVLIEGYDGSAMEPFIAPDGRYLLLNNENDPAVNTNVHFAERTGKRSFRYLGELPGVNSAVLDAVPSMDRSAHFFFTTLRDYDRTGNSIFTGDFDGKSVSHVRPAPGDISPGTPGSINMDVSISPDGETLYISRALIFPGAPAPKKAELMVARLRDGAFHIDPNSEALMRNVNTGALQYAPSISADGLELYFTRASQVRGVRLMVATRNSVSEAFGEPRVLSALTGFVEAPTITLDGGELFYHKRVGQKYVIYRAERRTRRPTDILPGNRRPY